MTADLLRCRRANGVFGIRGVVHDCVADKTALKPFVKGDWGYSGGCMKQGMESRTRVLADGRMRLQPIVALR